MLLRLEKKKTISRLVRMFVFWERGVGAVVRLFVFLGEGGRGSYYSKNTKNALTIIKYKAPLYDKIR